MSTPHGLPLHWIGHHAFSGTHFPVEGFLIYTEFWIKPQTLLKGTGKDLICRLQRVPMISTSLIFLWWNGRNTLFCHEKHSWSLVQYSIYYSSFENVTKSARSKIYIYTLPGPKNRSLTLIFHWTAFSFHYAFDVALFLISLCSVLFHCK